MRYTVGYMLEELNPFRPGAGLQPPELTGREEQLAAFEALVLRSKNRLTDRGLIMSGLRGVGKTALLNRLYIQAEQHQWMTVFIEGQTTGQGAATVRQRLGALIQAGLAQFSAAHRIQAGLEELRQLVGDFTFSLGPAQVRHTAPSRTNTGLFDMDVQALIEELAQLAKKKKAAFGLFIDEMQDLEPELVSALLVTQHRCQQRDLPFYVIGAGLPNLPASLAARRSYAERLFHYSIVDALPPHAAASALTIPAERQGCSFTPEAVELLVKESRGYPYFLQEFGKATWNIAQDHTFTRDDALAGIHVGNSHLDAGFFPSRWLRASDLERSYLQAMATLPETHPRSAAVAHSLGLAPSDLTKTRASLISKGLIYSPERGQVAFTVPGMNDYIARQIDALGEEPHPALTRRPARALGQGHS